MAQDVSLKGITEGLKQTGLAIRRRTGIIYAVIVLAALIYSIFSVNLILGTPSDAEYRSQKEAESFSTRFDEATIKKINTLKARQEAGNVTLPGGRINPFAE